MWFLSIFEAHHQSFRNGLGTSSSSSPHDVHVSLLSREDGRPDIVRAAVDLARRVATRDLAPAAIDEDLVTANLRANRGMPDPDLLVRFGAATSNMGFLPWQTRLTEMHRIESHLYLGWSDLRAVLEKYSNCGQRFGK